MAEIKINEIPEKVKEHYLFKYLTSSEANELVGSSKLEVIPAETIIWSRKDKISYIAVLLAGKLKISLIDSLGNEFSIRHIVPVDSLGDATIVGDDGQMSDVWTVEKSTVLFVWKKDILKILEKNHRATLSLCEELARRVNNLTRELELQVFSRSTLKIIFKLIQLRQGGSDEIKITHQQLAELVGMTRERLTLGLDELQERNLIKKMRGKITILNLGELKREIEDIIFS